MVVVVDPIDSVLLYVLRNHEAYKGRGAQDGHLDSHTTITIHFIHPSGKNTAT